MSKYLSTVICKRGHIGYRYVRTGNCCECERLRSRARCTTEKWRAYQRAYLRKRHRSDPAYREKKRAIRYRSYWKDGSVLERVNRRYAKKRNATPPWLTKEHILEMKHIYAKAREISKTTGIKMSVDHIVPLISKQVCGLHVPWNLQIISALENSRKRNNLDYLFG